MKEMSMMLIALASIIIFCGCSEEISHQEKPSNSRIGIYDSRAVTVAFAGSKPFREWMLNPMSEYLEAKTQDDQERMKELEKEFERRQTLLHTQTFSTAPIDNILGYIQEQMATIATEQQLDAIVSKWDEQTLQQYPSATRIDVTMEMVDALNPTERQRKSALEIQSKKPISIEEARNIKD